MPLANFPVKSQTPNRAAEFRLPPQRAKKEHRSARIYELRSPGLPRPEAALIHDRPPPILALPGLPPSPVTILFPDEAQEKSQKNFAKKMAKTGKAWLDQMKLPFSMGSDPLTPRISKTAEWVNESWQKGPALSRYHKADPFRKAKTKKLNLVAHTRNGSDEHEEWRRDPPPLYAKYTEGGLKAWLAVAGAFLVQFCTFGFLFAWNVFEDYYAHDFLSDQSPIAIRFIANFQWFLVFFLSVVSGKLTDDDHFHSVLVGGSVLFSCSSFLLSFVKEEKFGLVFALQAVGMGTGIGLVFVPSATIVTRYFKRRRGLAIGIAMSGGSFGGLVLPAVLRATLPTRGFATAVRITAGLDFVLLAIGCGLLFNPPQEPKLLMPKPRLDLAKYSKEMEYLCLIGGVFLAMFVLYYPAFYLELLGLTRNIAFPVAANTILVLSLTGVVGSIGLCVASDKVGPWNLFMFVNGLLAIMMLGMNAISNRHALTGFAFFYGIFLASWLSLTVAAISSLASERETSTRVGLVFTVSSFPHLFSGLIQNAVLGNGLQWSRMSILAGIVFVGVTVLFVISRVTLSKKLVGRRRKFIAGIPYFQIV